jgi:hypothetical protein
MSTRSIRRRAIAGCTAAALTLSVGASARTLPIAESATQGLHGQTVVLAAHAKPDFAARTAGKATFAMLGAGAMIAAGNQLVAENDVDDPAVTIGNELLQGLVARDGAIAAPAATAQVDSDDPARLAAAYPGGTYVLDVRTSGWSFGYYPTSWAHYRVQYGVKLRLVDTRSKSVVAEAACVRHDDDEPNAPTHDELLANRAERLKAMLHAHAQACLDELRQKVLGLKS